MKFLLLNEDRKKLINNFCNRFTTSTERLENIVNSVEALGLMACLEHAGNGGEYDESVHVETAYGELLYKVPNIRTLSKPNTNIQQCKHHKYIMYRIKEAFSAHCNTVEAKPANTEIHVAPITRTIFTAGPAIATTISCHGMRGIR